MTFTQALALIEQLSREMEEEDNPRLWVALNDKVLGLLHDHTDNLVQLGKIAEKLRYAREGSRSEQEACAAYDKLLKGARDE